MSFGDIREKFITGLEPTAHLRHEPAVQYNIYYMMIQNLDQLGTVQCELLYRRFSVIFLSHVYAINSFHYIGPLLRDYIVNVLWQWFPFILIEMANPKN